jgi:hypothetical protein
MQKKQAKIQRKNAERTAQTQRMVARNQAGRVAREQAETNVANTTEAARQRGVVYAAENRGGRQLAALVRQVDREEQANRTAIDMRLASANGNVRDAYANIGTAEANAFRSNPGPQALEYTNMGLTIGSSMAMGGVKGANLWSKRQAQTLGQRTYLP